MKYYSFVMGMSENILKLKELGFDIESYGDNYGITFTDDKADIWERFISDNIENGYWNEYLGDDIVFIFKHSDGKLERLMLNSENESYILKLCSQFAEQQFESIREMLEGNSFYKEVYFSKHL